MNPATLKDWWPLVAAIVGWIIVGSVGWTKMVGKVNGLGGRVKKVEEAGSASSAEVKALSAQLSEYRGDAKEANARMSRLEKGVEELHEEITQGNIGLGSQLSEISKSLTKMDKDISGRLVRVETVVEIEKKIGKPIPTE